MLIKSLSARVIWTTSLLVLLSLSALTYAGLSYFEKEFRRIISEQQSTMVSELAKEIDDKLELAARVVGRAAETVSPGFLQQGISAEIELNREAELQEVFPAGMYILDQQGKLLAGTTHSEFLSQRFENEPLFFRYRKVVGQAYISEVFPHEGRPEPFLLFSAPIRNAKTEIVGYLAGGMNLLHKDILGRLPLMKLGENGYLFLYDETRRLLIPPDPGTDDAAGCPARSESSF